MDIEWAKDGLTGELFIVQARPETVQSRKDADVIEIYQPQATRAGARHRAQRRRKDRRRPGARDQERAIPRPVSGGRSAGHRQDRSRLGADHEEGRGHRHEPRRAHVPCGHRQPRTGRAGHRRHRTRHRGACSDGQMVTVSCAEGETGFVYDGAAAVRGAAREPQRSRPPAARR